MGQAASSSADGGQFTRVCKHGSACKIMKAVKDKYEHTEGNLAHLSEFIHPGERGDCRWGAECRKWRRLADGGERLDDKCHCAVYQHPPRVHRDLAAARWRRWNTLAYDTQLRKYGNRFYNPLVEGGRAHDEMMERYKRSSPDSSPLEEEVRAEGFGRVLTCPGGAPLSKVVLQKLACKEHVKLGSPLMYDGMLSLILYTGTDAYADLRKYHLEHQEEARPGVEPTPYTRWNTFDFALEQAITALGAAQLRVYGPRRGLPTNHVFHGSNQCDGPELEAHERGGDSRGGMLPTVTSFSWNERVAKLFARGEGLMIRVNVEHAGVRQQADAQFAEEGLRRERAGTWWCDVSWVSKFPGECEALFSHTSRLGDFEGRRVLSEEPKFVELAFDLRTTIKARPSSVGSTVASSSIGSSGVLSSVVSS